MSIPPLIKTLEALDVGVGLGVLVGVGLLVGVGVVRVGVWVGVRAGVWAGVGVGDRTPAPIKPTVVTGAVASTMSVPVSVPAACGLKLTATLQLEPVPSESPQVVEAAAKSPLAVILEIKISELPRLVKVTFRSALVVSIFWSPNRRVGGDAVIHVPVPLKLAVCGLF